MCVCVFGAGALVDTWFTYRFKHAAEMPKKASVDTATLSSRRGCTSFPVVSAAALKHPLSATHGVLQALLAERSYQPTNAAHSGGTRTGPFTFLWTPTWGAAFRSARPLRLQFGFSITQALTRANANHAGVRLRGHILAFIPFAWVVVINMEICGWLNRLLSHKLPFRSEHGPILCFLNSTTTADHNFPSTCPAVWSFMAFHEQE